MSEATIVSPIGVGKPKLKAVQGLVKWDKQKQGRLVFYLTLFRIIDTDILTRP